MFHAGICHGILEGWDWLRTFEFANWAAGAAANRARRSRGHPAVAEWSVVTPEPDIQIGTITETVTETQLASPWNVIVHNDPVTLMSYVTMVFQRVFGYDYQKAHHLMMEVHNDGRSVVWTGAREQAEIYLHKLHAAAAARDDGSAPVGVMTPLVERPVRRQRCA